MPLRQIMPDAYQLVVYPMDVSGTTNSLGNKTFSNDLENPVVRGCTSIRVAETREIINPAYVDRVVTHIRIATTRPSEWHEGDLVDLPNMGRYRVSGDPEVDNLGPIKFMNHLFGGAVMCKRVS